MKKIVLTALMASLVAVIPAASVWGALTSVTESWSGNVAIPDNSTSGPHETVTFNTGITSITDIQVRLDIVGAAADDGDYYAYLRDNQTGTLAVLLNRVGRTPQQPYGSAAAGMDVTFTQTAANGDIHYNAPLSGGAITGDWQVDGRLVSPYTVESSSPRTALLSSFVGLNPNTLWTLFIADLSPGGVGALTGFSVTVDGNVVAVPESPTGLGGLLAFGLASLAAFGVRSRHKD